MTVAQLIRKLKKMPQDAIVTMSNNELYVNGEYTVTSVETYDCSTVEICTDYERNLTKECEVGMGVSDTTEADWEEYYRNVNAFNIPNADAKRVEIWDKAFLSTKTVRETLWEVYSKGFMDGVNDQAERYKDSAYRQKHDSELLDKAMQKQRTIIDEDGVMYRAVLLKDIEELKAEVK